MNAGSEGRKRYAFCPRLGKKNSHAESALEKDKRQPAKTVRERVKKDCPWAGKRNKKQDPSREKQHRNRATGKGKKTKKLVASSSGQEKKGQCGSLPSGRKTRNSKVPPDLGPDERNAVPERKSPLPPRTWNQ